jgi:hypothetical protein
MGFFQISGWTAKHGPVRTTTYLIWMASNYGQPLFLSANWARHSQSRGVHACEPGATLRWWLVSAAANPVRRQLSRSSVLLFMHRGNFGGWFVDPNIHWWRKARFPASVASKIRWVRVLDFVGITGGADGLYIGGFSWAKKQKLIRSIHMGFDLGENNFVRNSLWGDGPRWASLTGRRERTDAM